MNGRRIALLERRHSQELAALVRERGGLPISAPAMEEVASHDDFNTFYDGLIDRRFSVAIFLNGAGVTKLLAEADRRGRLSRMVGALRGVTIVTRGAKPIGALARHGLKPQITTAKPHTTVELVAALSAIGLQDRGVVLVHYGERNRTVADALRRLGARLNEICPYEWIVPGDREPLMQVIRGLIAGQLDAVLFTNRVQCRHLFEVATEMTLARGLVLSLNQQAVVGAIGPVCARALVEAGVNPHVIPRVPNMQALIEAMAQHFEAASALEQTGLSPVAP